MRECIGKCLVSNDAKRFLMILIPIVIGVAIALVSAYFLGADNPIEEFTEEQLDEIIEDELGLPDDSVDIDFTPSPER